MTTIPLFNENLNEDQIKFLQAFALNCRHSIIEMVKNAQSGHPGGSLSSIDYLAVLYSFILSQTGEEIVVSNGHISPAVYSVLAELDYIPKTDVIQNFRKIGSIYEGHVTRHVPGVFYGTGPLGIGVSVGAAFALGEKLKKTEKKVYAVMGDGEAQEGQVHEMILLANKYQLNNLILFVDDNQVQLSASIDEIMPINLKGFFEAGNWEVLEVDGHDYSKIWQTLSQAQNSTKPVVILGKTIMGKGVDYMEVDGKNLKATWHGSAPKPEQADTALQQLQISEDQQKILTEFKSLIKWHPEKPSFTPSLTLEKIQTGTPRVYTLETLTDCRTAYGEALLDLAKLNPNVLALTADLRGSVMTKFLAAEYSNRHIECGIAEQNMVSVAGGLSLQGFIPFTSTFGAFMSSRAKDQARVNDINHTNVKMVATHCGLSVGEDGPTHQSIDDTGSFLGMFNTMVIEPADPNQTDRIIRYIASHYGNFYVRMGRHKFPILTKADGTPFYDENYEYVYGKTDIIREGNQITIVATGALNAEALKAYENLKQSHPEFSLEIIAASSIKKFDDNIINSLRKTKKLITAEDHNALSGLAGQINKLIVEHQIQLDYLKNIAVSEYLFSGKAEELYEKAGISAKHIEEACKEALK